MLHCELISLLVILLLFNSRAFSNSPKKYQIPDFKANWFKANEFCNSIEMQLATIGSQDENDAVAQFVRSTDKFSDVMCSFWIGGTDLAEEGTFRWVSSGQPVTYANWSRDEPNNGDNSENCLQLVYIPKADQRWTWNDNQCRKQQFNFICESVPRDCMKPLLNASFDHSAEPLNWNT